MRDLYAVATSKGRLCPDCAVKKYGKDLENIPEEDTVVFRSDDWKHQVIGPCDEADCTTFIGED